jgi:hypothetical protein
MGKRIRKCLKWIFHISLFCGYFYILFVNLVCGFSIGGIKSRWDAAKILMVAFILAAGLPGIIWYQHHQIEKLEQELDDIDSI